jgi:hypothetical protein
MLTRPLGLALLLLVGSSLRAAEPQATFALVKGELAISVEQDGKPIKNMKIRVLDLGGTTLLSAEEIDGTISFPSDRRSGYLVGITIPGKKKEADFVTLRRKGNTLTPPRVLLGFSKPCCRVALSSKPESAPATPDVARPDKRSIAWIVFGVSGACLLAAGMMLMFFRRS